MDQQRSNDAAGGQLTCSTLSLMVPTLRLMSAFAWQVVQHSNVVHYGKVEELVQLVTEVVPHLLSDTEKVHLLVGLRATEEFPEADLQTLVWEFISRVDKLLPLPDIKQTAELLTAAPSLLEECGQLAFESAQLKTLLHHHTQQGNNKEFEPEPTATMTQPEPSSHYHIPPADDVECSWVQSQGTILSTASSPQRHRTEEDNDRQSEEEEGVEGKQSDEEWLPEDCSKVILQSDDEWLPVNDHIIEEEEGAEGKQSDEEWVHEDCSKTKRRRNEFTGLKKRRRNILSSVSGSGSKRNNPRRFEDTLCELVRKHAHLYDVTSPLYRCKDVRQNSWDEISSTLELSAKECREKWRFIRDGFVRAHNKVLKKRSSGDLSLIQRLEWLKSYISHRPAVNNDPNNDDIEQHLSPSVSSLPVQAGRSQHHEVEPEPTATMTQPEASSPSHLAPVTADDAQCYRKRNDARRVRFEDTLCELVRNYVHLYDVTSSLRKRKDVRQKSWDKIGSTLKLSAKECRDKWKVLRDGFVRAHNKVLEKRSSYDLSIIQRLVWLKSYISHRPAVTNDPNNDDMHLSPSVSSLPILAGRSQHLEGSLVQSQSTIPSTASSPQSKPQQNCSNIQRSGRKLSPHRTEEDKHRQSDHIIEEEEGAEGKQSDEEWLPEDCSKTKKKINESTDLKKRQTSSVSGSGSSNRRRFEDRLSELVRKHAHLYDVTSPLYRCKDVRQNSWDEISSTLELSAKRCQDRWKAMRDGFVKAHNKVLEKRSRGDLSLIQCLEWLKSYISRRPAVKNYPNNDDMEQHLTPSVRSLPVQAGHSQHHEGVDLYTEPGLHACPQHSSSHSQEDAVLQHIRQEHTTKHDYLPHSDTTAMKSNKRPIHRCSYCGLEFTHFYLLKCHMGIHTMPFHCDHCDKRYAQRNGLIEHRRLHTGERPFTCTHCGRGFHRSGTLQQHVHTHTGERRYTCHICGKTSIQHLLRHMRMHKGEKNYLCTECGKAFLTKGELGKHTRWHTGERPHTCKLCGKRFVGTSELTVHMRIHSGEKPYSCTHCPKAFRCSSKLKRHMFIHSDKKPYECSKCGKGFTQSSNRRVHMRTCKKHIPV